MVGGSSMRHYSEDLQRRRQLPRSGVAHVLNVKLWGCGNEMILYFSVQLVEKLGGGGGADPPQSEKWEGLSSPCPPISRP